MFELKWLCTRPGVSMMPYPTERETLETDMPRVHPERLTVLRRAHGWSPERLEQELEFLVQSDANPGVTSRVSATHIRRLERGVTGSSRALTVDSIAAALKVDRDVLTGEMPMPESTMRHAKDSGVDQGKLKLARAQIEDREDLLRLAGPRGERLKGEAAAPNPTDSTVSSAPSADQNEPTVIRARSWWRHVPSASASAFAFVGGVVFTMFATELLEPNAPAIATMPVALDEPRPPAPTASPAAVQTAAKGPPFFTAGVPPFTDPDWFSPTASAEARAQREQVATAWSTSLLISEWAQHRQTPTTVKGGAFRAFARRQPPVGPKAQQDAQKAFASYDDEYLNHPHELWLHREEYLTREERTRLFAAILNHPQELWLHWQGEWAALDAFLQKRKGGAGVASAAEVLANQGTILVDLFDPQASFSELLSTARNHDADLCIIDPPFTRSIVDAARVGDLVFVPCRPFKAVVSIWDT